VASPPPAEPNKPVVPDTPQTTTSPAASAALPASRKSTENKPKRSLDVSRPQFVDEEDKPRTSAMQTSAEMLKRPGADGDAPPKLAQPSKPTSGTSGGGKPPPPTNIILFPCLKKKTVKSTNDFAKVHWHSISEEEVATQLDTHLTKGLTTAAAEVRDRPPLPSGRRIAVLGNCALRMGPPLPTSGAVLSVAIGVTVRVHLPGGGG
jgi:hypothetical protein